MTTYLRDRTGAPGPTALFGQEHVLAPTDAAQARTAALDRATQVVTVLAKADCWVKPGGVAVDAATAGRRTLCAANQYVDVPVSRFERDYDVFVSAIFLTGGSGAVYVMERV